MAEDCCGSTGGFAALVSCKAGTPYVTKLSSRNEPLRLPGAGRAPRDVTFGIGTGPAPERRSAREAVLGGVRQTAPIAPMLLDRCLHR